MGGGGYKRGRDPSVNIALAKAQKVLPASLKNLADVSVHPFLRNSHEKNGCGIYLYPL